MYATVVIDISSKQLNNLFDYKIPTHLTNKVKRGMRVVVDFNNRKRLAYIVKINETSKLGTKEILYVLDEKPILTNIQLKLIEHLQNRSFCSYIEAFKTVVPQALHGKYEYTFKVVDNEKLPEKLTYAVKDNILNITKLKEEDFSLFNKTLDKQIIKKLTTIKDKVNISYTKKLFIKDENKNLTAKQKEILDQIKEPILIEELIELGYSKDIINRLIKQSVIGYNLVEKYKECSQKFNLKEPTFILTSEQEKAVNEVDMNKPLRYLLFGPPASGKTEVYLRLIKKVINSNKQVLILVPEISLIPQITSRIKNRFNDKIAVYHSKLTAKERYDTYRKAKDNVVNIIIGTRSSIFLPINSLGLIILDEAHDMSYIQKNQPYYDTKELSFLLSQLKKCPVVLGTATPTVSNYYDASLGKLKLLKLSKLNDDVKTKIKLIDMKEELIKGNTSMFSNELKFAIKKTLEKKEQIIILINRRGYAPFVLCRNCGYVYKCPTCNISLVYHKNENLLKCHHCGYVEPNSKECKICHKNKVKPIGFGSEQVEEQLIKEFKNIRVIRMDYDTTKHKDKHDTLLTNFLNYEADVLLGTQMVSKGHHFDKVSLVIVMLADQMLNLNSYLANELTYNLLTQHIGRIRNKNGLAILQAYDTNHYVLNSVIKKDYNLYYEQELKTRKLLKLEPFYNVVKITFKGKNQQKTFNDLLKLKLNFIARNSQVTAFGPSENYIFYLNKKYHYNLTFKIPKSFNINSLMNYFDKKYTKEYNIDIDYYPDVI